MTGWGREGRGITQRDDAESICTAQEKNQKRAAAACLSSITNATSQFK